MCILGIGGQRPVRGAHGVGVYILQTRGKTRRVYRDLAENRLLGELVLALLQYLISYV